MKKLQAILIDDSEDARKSLKADLTRSCPEVDLIGEADGVVSGLKLLREKEPDLVFLDIHLQDGVGFDILEILPGLKAKVIFTTSDDSYAIKAFKFSAIDYLLKPFGSEDLVEAVTKVRRSESQNTDLLMKQLSGNRMERIALHTAEKIQILQIEDIIRCEAQVNYTQFYISGQKPILVTKTLKHFAGLLSDEGFFRVHQSHLINMKHVREFVKSDGGYILMDNGDSVPVSSRKKGEVMERISNIR